MEGKPAGLSKGPRSPKRPVEDFVRGLWRIRRKALERAHRRRIHAGRPRRLARIPNVVTARPATSPARVPRPPLRSRPPLPLSTADSRPGGSREGDPEGIARMHLHGIFSSEPKVESQPTRHQVPENGPAAMMVPPGHDARGDSRLRDGHASRVEGLLADNPRGRVPGPGGLPPGLLRLRAPLLKGLPTHKNLLHRRPLVRFRRAL